MTQPPESTRRSSAAAATITPSAIVARRIRELREGRGWSAARLAERCAEAGMPQLTRSVLANLESGRRSGGVTLEEAFTLAHALDVAPIYLFLPVDATMVEVTPRWAVGAGIAREWVRGRFPLPDQDADRYWTRRPEREWDAEKEAANAGRLIEDLLQPPVEGST